MTHPVCFKFFTDMKQKSKSQDKLVRYFVEGWIEFLSKLVAKEVASNHNQGKKQSDCIKGFHKIYYIKRGLLKQKLLVL